MEIFKTASRLASHVAYPEDGFPQWVFDSQHKGSIIFSNQQFLVNIKPHEVKIFSAVDPKTHFFVANVCPEQFLNFSIRTLDPKTKKHAPGLYALPLAIQSHRFFKSQGYQIPYLSLFWNPYYGMDTNYFRFAQALGVNKVTSEVLQSKTTSQVYEALCATWSVSKFAPSSCLYRIVVLTNQVAALCEDGIYVQMSCSGAQFTLLGTLFCDSK